MTDEAPKIAHPVSKEGVQPYPIQAACLILCYPSQKLIASILAELVVFPACILSLTIYDNSSGCRLPNKTYMQIGEGGISTHSSTTQKPTNHGE